MQSFCPARKSANLRSFVEIFLSQPLTGQSGRLKARGLLAAIGGNRGEAKCPCEQCPEVKQLAQKPHTRRQRESPKVALGHARLVCKLVHGAYRHERQDKKLARPGASVP